MAVFVSARRRRRRAVAIAGAVLLVGLLAGGAIGRLTAPSVDDAVSAARRRGGDLGTRLGTLPFEYGQLQQGAAGKSTGTFVATVHDISAEASRGLDATPWLSAASRQSVLDPIDRIASDAAAGVAADDLSADVDRATKAVEDTFAVEPSG